MTEALSRHLWHQQARTILALLGSSCMLRKWWETMLSANTSRICHRILLHKSYALLSEMSMNLVLLELEQVGELVAAVVSVRSVVRRSREEVHTKSLDARLALQYMVHRRM